MSDTQMIEKDSTSTLLGVSIRGWIAMVVAVGVALNQLLVTIFTLIHASRSGDFTLVGNLSTIGEPFYSLTIGAIAYYFGQKTAKT